jgi:modulator of FtsH protease HflC
VRTSTFSAIAAFVALIIIVLAWSSLYVVRQTEFALPIRLGEPLQPKLQPGLYFKVPFTDNIVRLDKRILDLDTQPLEVIASDQKRLVVDAFSRYRIIDPLAFYQNFTDTDGAEQRLNDTISSALRRVLGQATFLDVVRNRRDELMGKIRTEVNQQMSGRGIDIVDVRIRRADLPEANSQSVFDRMKTQRAQEAAQYRAEGAQENQRIRAEADRTVAQLLGEANGSSETIRGDADAQKVRIFAKAYGPDPEFFAFYRSLQAYTDSLKATQTRFILRPDSDFFRYLFNPTASPVLPAPATPATPPTTAPAQ